MRRRGLRVPLLSAAVLARGLSVSAADVVTAPLHIVFGAANIPHPEKADRGGEDSFFADDSTGTFGVADGVGGSATKFADPGKFSREILRRCHMALLPGVTVEDGLRTASKESLGLGGSSTLLLGQLIPETNAMHLLNLGDSGAMLLRPCVRRFKTGSYMWPRIVMRSVEQTHAFNTPYQTDAKDFAKCITHADDLVTVAREGDVLVAATDGVLDNLFDQQIQTTVAKCLSQLRAVDADKAQEAIDSLALTLAQEAHEVGLQQDAPDVRTPFELAAAQEGYRFLGGKLDDVAVVCGVVRKGESPPPRGLKCNF